MQLKDLIKATIPETILSNKVSNDVIDILLDYVEQNNYISFDISELFKVRSKNGSFVQVSDSVTITVNNHGLINEQQTYCSFAVSGDDINGYYTIQYIDVNNFKITTNVKSNRQGLVTIGNSVVTKELIKTYLNNLYIGFQKAILDDDIIRALARDFNFSGNTYVENNRLVFSDGTNDTNYLLTEDNRYIDTVITTVLQFDMKYFKQLEAFLNEEFLLTSKAFKQKKGTRAAIRYAYNIFRQSGLQSDGFFGTNDESFNIYSNNSFKLLYDYDLNGIKNINVSSDYVKITFFIGTNLTKIPQDIRILANKTVTNNTIHSSVTFGYRINNIIDPLELIGDNISIQTIDRGNSGTISGTFTNSLGNIQQVNINIDGTFSNNITSPFTYVVEGSLYPEIFENGIKPIVHPLGYDYIYRRIVTLWLLDRLSDIVSYENTDVRVRCNNGLIPDVTYNNSAISKIDIAYDNFKNVKETITFLNNTYIVRDFDSTVIYYNADNSINVSYSPACALYLSYTANISSGIVDTINTELTTRFNEFVTASNIDEALKTQSFLNITTQDDQDINIGISESTISENINFLIEYFIYLITEDGINIADESINILNIA
jgi:hypothetical protein